MPSDEFLAKAGGDFGIGETVGDQIAVTVGSKGEALKTGGTVILDLVFSVHRITGVGLDVLSGKDFPPISFIKVNAVISATIQRQKERTLPVDEGVNAKFERILFDKRQFHRVFFHFRGNRATDGESAMVGIKANHFVFETGKAEDSLDGLAGDLA